VAVQVGAKHIDVTVQLTFFEEGAEHERGHMDANRDGRITRREIDAYLRGLESELGGAVKMRVGGAPVALTPLRLPELDLLGHEAAGRGHCRLTLYYFAPTPANLEPNAGIEVADRLWPGMRALGTMQVEGKDGCRLEALPVGESVYPAARENEARVFRARVLLPPGSLKPKLPGKKKARE
jgi:hypothetical protein